MISVYLLQMMLIVRAMMRAMSKVEEMELMDIVTAMDMTTPAATMTIMRLVTKRGMRRAMMMVIVLVNQSTKRNKMRRKIGSINF